MENILVYWMTCDWIDWIADTVMHKNVRLKSEQNPKLTRLTITLENHSLQNDPPNFWWCHACAYRLPYWGQHHTPDWVPSITPRIGFWIPQDRFLNTYPNTGDTSKWNENYFVLSSDIGTLNAVVSEVRLKGGFRIPPFEMFERLCLKAIMITWPGRSQCLENNGHIDGSLLQFPFPRPPMKGDLWEREEVWTCGDI